MNGKRGSGLGRGQVRAEVKGRNKGHAELKLELKFKALGHGTPGTVIDFGRSENREGKCGKSE